MSATLQADKFSSYFDNAKVLYIQGRQFPVQVSSLLLGVSLLTCHMAPHRYITHQSHSKITYMLP